jgi:hypothetical protein
VLYVDENGQLRLIPTSFTDVLEIDPFIQISSGRCIITYNDLQSLRHIVDSIKGL